MSRLLLTILAIGFYLLPLQFANAARALDAVEGTITEIPVPNARSTFLLDDGAEIFTLLWSGTHAPLWLSTGDQVVAVGSIKQDELTIDTSVAGSQLIEIPAIPTAADERAVLVVTVDLKGPHGSISSVAYLNAIYRRVFWKSANGEAGTDDNLSVDNFYRVATGNGIAFPEYLGRATTVSIKAPKICTLEAYRDAVETKVNQQDLFYGDFQHVAIFLPLRRYTGCPFTSTSTLGDGSGTEFYVGESSNVLSVARHIGLNMGLTGTLSAVIDGSLVEVDFGP
jgi:hypothetical protein